MDGGVLGGGVLRRHRERRGPCAYPGRVSEPAENRSTALPILVAAGVVALVLIGAMVSRMFRSEEISAEAGIGRAALGQNDALQREDYAGFLRYTCAAERGSETGVLAGQRRSAAAKGARFVDNVGGFVVTGDRASATVTYYFERSADEKVPVPTTFVREDGQWKVCSPGPG